MATRRTKTTTPAQDVLDPSEHFVGTSNPPGFPIANGVQYEEEDPEPPTPTDRIAAMLGEARGDERAKVKLYKLIDGAANWCEDYTPETFEAGGMPMVRVKWGPGLFRVVLYATRADGGFGIRARDEIRLLPMLDEPASAARATGALDGQAILQAIRDSNAALVTALQGQQRDPAAQMRETLSLMTLMREAMGLTGGNGGQSQTVSSILDDLRKMQKAAKEFGVVPAEEKKDDDPIQSLVAQLAPVLLAAVQKGNSNGNAEAVPVVTLPASLAVGPVAAPALAASGVGAATVPAEGGASVPEDDMQALYSSLMDYYNRLAKMGGDPEAAALQLYHQIPDEGLKVLQQEDWWTYFLVFSPKSEPYREWFTKVRDEVLKIIADEAKDDAAP